MKKTTFSIIFFVILVVSLIVLNQTVLDVTPRSVRRWILTMGAVAPFVYVLLYSVRPFVLFPASVLSLTGGLAFGPVWGFILTLTGATIGALLAFFTARKIGARRIESRWGRKLHKLQNVLEKNGFLVIILLRLIPIFHFDLISYAAGMSKVKSIQFFFGTLIGIVPGTFAYTFLGASTAADTSTILYIAIILFIIITVLPVLYKKQIKQYLSVEDQK